MAAAGIPLMAGAAWLGGWWLFALVLALSLLGFREFSVIVGGSFRRPVWLWGLAGVLLAMAYLRFPGFPIGAAVLWVLILLALVLAAGDQTDTAKEAGLCLLGVAYIPPMLGHLMLIRNIAPPSGFLTRLLHSGSPERGFWLLLWTMALVWIGDTGAYFAGLLFGRRKLAPAVSPNKTVEGLAGCLLTTAAAAVALEAWWRLGLGPWHALALALIVTSFSTLGDLVESKLKRLAGVKDSGSLLPGHGGVLDRFDSLMFAAPAVYWYIKIVLH